MTTSSLLKIARTSVPKRTSITAQLPTNAKNAILLAEPAFKENSRAA